MDTNERNMFAKLMESVECAKEFRCVDSEFRDMCKGKYHLGADVLECLEDHPGNCKFAIPVRTRFRCTCTLRIFIGQHFEKWTTYSTAFLRDR